MLDDIIYYFPFYALGVIALIALVKILLFIKFKSRNDGIINIIHFPHVNIAITPSQKKQTIKKLQNLLSLAILILFVMVLVVKFLFIR